MVLKLYLQVCLKHFIDDSFFTLFNIQSQLSYFFFSIGGKIKKVKLDEEGLALGALMVSSAKVKRDIVDEGWNKWVFNDDHLPDWFVEDEKKHMIKDTPVPQVVIHSYTYSLSCVLP